MRIGFVWDGNYPWDIRVEKICRSLVGHGHEVHLICRNSRREPREEIIDGMRVHRLPYLNGSDSLNRLINFPLFFNPVWCYNIRSVVRSERVEVLIVRDITLSLTALAAAEKSGIPVVLDMAEPYPEMIRAQHRYENLGAVEKLVRNATIADWVEKKTLRDVAAVFAMVEESKDRMIRMGVPGEKIVIVSNTPDLERFSGGRKSYPGSMSGLKSMTVLFYVGYMHQHRGLNIAIRGMKHILEKDKNIALVIVGKGDGEDELKRLADELGVADHVFFEGYQHHSLVPDYIASSDIGIIPHFSCGLWDNTIPNKLFDYMCMAKPVLCSDTKPVKRIVEQERCGLVYKDTDPEDFARKALEMLAPDVRGAMAKNGLNAVARRYNWEMDSGVMIDTIMKLKRPRVA